MNLAIAIAGSACGARLQACRVDSRVDVDFNVVGQAVGLPPALSRRNLLSLLLRLGRPRGAGCQCVRDHALGFRDVFFRNSHFFR